MAPKRSSLIKHPPAASSSSEQLENENEEEEEEEVESEIVVVVSEEEQEQATEGGAGNLDKTHKKSKPSTSNPILKLTKCVAYKPMPAKRVVVKKPTLLPTTSALLEARTSGKRPLEAEKAEKEKDIKRNKKKKKKVNDNCEDEDGNHQTKGVDGQDEDGIHHSGGGDRDRQKNPFKRVVFSEDDEIVILMGMCESIKKGIDPTSNNEFLDSILNSIHVDISKKQLKNKIGKLKTKYLNHGNKEGEGPSFSKPHDIECYKLIKEILGDGQEERIEIEGRKSKKDSNDALNNDNGKRSMRGLITNLSFYPCLNNSAKSNKNLNVMGEGVYKESLGKIGDSKAKELEQKWMNLHIRQLKNNEDRLKLQMELNGAVLSATNT